MIYDIKRETMPREELLELQLMRLQAQVDRVYATVPFYKKKFDELGIKPGDIKTLKDVSLLPFTERNNFV